MLRQHSKQTKKGGCISTRDTATFILYSKYYRDNGFYGLYGFSWVLFLYNLTPTDALMYQSFK